MVRYISYHTKIAGIGFGNTAFFYIYRRSKRLAPHYKEMHTDP